MLNRRQAIGGAAGGLLGTVLSAVEATAQGAPDNLSTTLDTLCRRLGLPAAGAIVVTRDRIVARGVCGVRRMGEPGLVSPDPHWQLGSITKTFTATLAALLIERGKLTWGTTLAQMYPEHIRIMAPRVGTITIRQIVTHHSGMFRDDSSPGKVRPDESAGPQPDGAAPAGVVLSLKAPLEFPPGDRSSYSNRAYNTLGPALEKITGRSYEEMIVQDIARPLGITSVVFGEPALGDPSHQPWPHVSDGGRWNAVPPVPLSMYGYHIFNPAGGISLTLEGFAIWMQTHLNGETSPRLLSKEMFKTLQTPIQSGGVPAFVMGPFALLGRSLSHGGTNGRNSADHLLLMDRGIGVFAAANALPPDNVPSWTLFSSLLMATALPGQWPMPATRPPSPDAGGKIEGEALEFIASSGGGIEFQNIKQLSGGFQLWWRGAKDGDRLTLRLSVPAKGRYVLEGVFAEESRFWRRSAAVRRTGEAFVVPGRPVDLGGDLARRGPARRRATRARHHRARQCRQRWNCLPSRSRSVARQTDLTVGGMSDQVCSGQSRLTLSCRRQPNLC